jgi:hypothetical protein
MDSIITIKPLSIKRTFNYEKILKLREVLTFKKLKITILSNNCDDEDFYINGYYLCNPLTNKTGVSQLNRNLKIKSLIDFNKNSTVTCKRVVSGLWIATIFMEYPFKVEYTFRGNTGKEALRTLKNKIGLN